MVVAISRWSASPASGQSTSALLPLQGVAPLVVSDADQAAVWLEEVWRVARSLDVSVVATAVRPLGS